MMRLPQVFKASIAGLALTLLAGAASAQVLDGGPLPQAAGTIKVDLKGQSAQSLSLPRGKSAVIELPVDVRDVHVTNAAVADVAMPHSRRIYVMGVGAGQTDAVFYDGAGRRILSLDIRVEQDLGGLAQTIARVAPGANVRAEAVNDRIILTGAVANISDADRIVRIAGSYAKAENVLNMMTIAGKDQVLLKVRIVEVQRNLLKQFGVNTEFIVNDGSDPSFFFSTSLKYATNGGLQGGLAAGGVDTASGNSNTGVLEAFERVGLIRTLAEPNLTAISGEGAKFLAGGEFPVPAALDKNGNVTVEFKSYGVGLGFTPVVLSNGRISLKVSTEVSDITPVGSFSSGGVGGSTITIPGITVRRAETTVEMSSGGQMMIAGLLRQELRQSIDGIPGLKDINVLGSLFRSRDYLNGETEMVVLIQPLIVDPTSPGKLQSPADGLVTESDMKSILLGRLNSVYKVTPQPGSSYQGPYGHVIE